ncbi:hypothetical protein YC2023_075369 [Brassica napus]
MAAKKFVAIFSKESTSYLLTVDLFSFDFNLQYPFSLPYAPLFIKMNILRGSSSGTVRRSRQTCLPPGATRPALSAS